MAAKLDSVSEALEARLAQVTTFDPPLFFVPPFAACAPIFMSPSFLFPHFSSSLHYLTSSLSSYRVSLLSI
jgi:hypothetical protein